MPQAAPKKHLKIIDLEGDELSDGPHYTVEK